MKEHLDDNSKCPSFEDISAFLDHELPPDSPTAQHIPQCPQCQQRLEEYRRIDHIIRSSIAIAPPDGLNDRIKAAIAREQRTIRFPAHLGTFLRLAAAFTVCCGVALYIITDNTTPPREPVGANREAAMESPRTLAMTTPRHAPTTAADDSPGYSPGRFNGVISAGSLVGASYGGGDTPVFTDAMATVDRTRKPVDIASQVQQVWSVRDAGTTAALLEGIMKKMLIPEKNIRLIPNGKSVKLIAGMTKLELVNLVRACRACGLELLSPTAPQPEQNVFTGNANSPVVYYAEFVSEK